MGYSLTIGEAAFDVDEVGDEWTENVQDEYIRVTAVSVELPEAPAFGEPTDHTNERWPSYSSWYDFCEDVDILPITFDMDEHGNDTGNIRGCHPGFFPITKAFKAEVDKAYDNWKKKYPNVVASYDNFEVYPENGQMCRLEWLKFWTDWSLENCKTPIFTNT